MVKALEKRDVRAAAGNWAIFNATARRLDPGLHNRATTVQIIRNRTTTGQVEMILLLPLWIRETGSSWAWGAKLSY